MSNSRNLSDEIALRRKKAADLRRQAELLEAEARGMEIANNMASPPAASLTVTRSAPSVANMPATPPLLYGGGSGVLVIPHHKGRQKGAISHTWRNILGELYANFPDGFGENQVCAAAERHQLKIRPKDARDRMLSYIEPRYIEVSGDGFKVTTHALQKFRLPSG